jgi:SRSO17 transposase
MTVHLACAGDATGGGGGFRTMLDSDLYLPACWDDDPQRRAEAQVPDDVHYRPKYDIAPPCRNYRKARANGVTLAWVTADRSGNRRLPRDEWYGEKPAFIAGLEQMGQRFVLEIPRNLMGWSHEPAGPEERRSKAEDLCRHSPVFTGQRWKRYHVKDSTKGPVVWEAKAAPFWALRDGAVVGPYRLMVARDVLDPDEVKYFLSDASGVPARVTLRVGLSRWPVERCLQDEKTELGLSHFECRKYPAVLRHLLVTQVSHLFLARQCQRLRGEKRCTARDGVPGPHRRRGAAGRVAHGRRGAATTDRPGGAEDPTDPETQRRGERESRQGASPEAACDGHPSRTTHVLPSAVTAAGVAL